MVNDMLAGIQHLSMPPPTSAVSMSGVNVGLMDCGGG